MKPFFLILLSIWISSSFGQNEGEIAGNKETRQVHLVFNQQEFGENFAILSISDDNYDYYVVDLTKLGGKFEKVYFMNLTYEDSRIINLDGDLEKDQTWFKSYYTNSEKEITCVFNDLKERTDKAGKEMSDAEKSEWMAKFNKFNSKNSK